MNLLKINDSKDLNPKNFFICSGSIVIMLLSTLLK